MSWYTDLLKEPAMYWEPPDRDGLGGYVWGSPSSLNSKWEDTKNLVYSSTGASIVSNTVVYVSSLVKVGGYLHAGSPLNDPTQEARQIISVDFVKSLKKQETVVYKAFLR